MQPIADAAARQAEQQTTAWKIWADRHEASIAISAKFRERLVKKERGPVQKGDEGALDTASVRSRRIDGSSRRIMGGSCAIGALMAISAGSHRHAHAGGRHSAGAMLPCTAHGATGWP